MIYRKLTNDEIKTLENQGCFCEDWQKIEVAQKFAPKYCRNVRFSGEVKIGETGRKIQSSSVDKNSGIYDAHIHNCIIGDGVYISKIGTHIANYHIGENTVIENSDTLEVRAKNSFGNGTKVAVLNENGGRSIPIFVGMSAQFAYLATFYRHNKKLIEKLEEIAKHTQKKFECDFGKIGSNVKILNAGTITDCNIGEYTQILNSARLHNGNIESSEGSPVRIGTGVIADHFLIHEGSSIMDRATISRCFVGEGCDLSRGFSAENSLFFSNFIGHHGEASAVFAGPHTVTHHKSSLLISGYFLFTNTGSGSNQSNNLYKMGPLHQGVFERGTKTASNSYVLYPARTGPFTLVMGRHVDHCDTKYMPYSYLIEQMNKSILIVGTNIKKVGTIRDADKWKVRDKRKGKKLDLINYDLLNPFSVSRMLHGRGILHDLKSQNAKEFIAGFNEQFYPYNKAFIPHESLSSGIRNYSMGAVKFFGNFFVKKLRGEPVNSVDDLRKMFVPQNIGAGEWLDIAGCLVPQSFVDELVKDIENGSVNTIEEFNKKFCEAHQNYPELAWDWCVCEIEKYYEKPMRDMDKCDILAFLDEWFAAVEHLDDCFLKDAQKEYSELMKIGFGIDGDADTVSEDFDEVRGEFSQNELVRKIQGHLENKRSLYENAKEIVKKYL